MCTYQVLIISCQYGLLQFVDVDARLCLTERRLLLGLGLVLMVRSAAAAAAAAAEFVYVRRSHGQFQRAHVRRGHTHWHVTVTLGRGDFHFLPHFLYDVRSETVLIHLDTGCKSTNRVSYLFAERLTLYTFYSAPTTACS